MKLAISCLSALMIATAGPLEAMPVSDLDRAALERLAAANDAAWNAKDVAAMAGQYTAHGSVRVSPASPTVEGSAAVSNFFGQAFGRRQGRFRHITTLDHLDEIAPGMAMADAAVRVEQQQPDGSWVLVRSFRNVSLVIREGGQWKLRAVRAIPQN